MPHCTESTPYSLVAAAALPYSRQSGRPSPAFCYRVAPHRATGNRAQALDALAGIAHLQAQAGQLEQPLTLIGMVQHHPSSYQESKARLVALEVELRSKLSPVQVQAALAGGQSGEL